MHLLLLLHHFASAAAPPPHLLFLLLQDEADDDEEAAGTEAEEDEEGFVVGDGYLSEDEGMRDVEEDAAAGARGLLCWAGVPQVFKAFKCPLFGSVQAVSTPPLWGGRWGVMLVNAGETESKHIGKNTHKKIRGKQRTKGRAKEEEAAAHSMPCPWPEPRGTVSCVLCCTRCCLCL